MSDAEELTGGQRRMIERLKGARGMRWAALLRRVFFSIGPMLARDGRRIRRQAGRMTALDVMRLADSYGLPFKTCCEYLEELPGVPDVPLSAVERKRRKIWCDPIIPYGTYTKLKDRGFRVSDAKEALKSEADTAPHKPQPPNPTPTT